MRLWRCGACGAETDDYAYRWVHLCYPCKRVAASWCWRKLQGIEREDIFPRHGDTESGQAYLCILCGYWHWTSTEGEASASLTEAVWALSRYFERVHFHINIARGWARIRYLAPTEGEQ